MLVTLIFLSPLNMKKLPVTLTKSMCKKFKNLNKWHLEHISFWRLCNIFRKIRLEVFNKVSVLKNAKKIAGNTCHGVIILIMSHLILLGGWFCNLSLTRKISSRQLLETYLGHYEISMRKRFVKVVNGF